jgi:hypothetical protein
VWGAKGAQEEVFPPFSFSKAELEFQPEKDHFMKILRGLVFGLFCTCSPVFAETLINAWTNPASGNWEDLKWSLGTRPGPGQSIMVTNQGWKAVAIGANTAQNFPQSMQIQDLQIASPVNSHNVLLMNFSGFQVPLQTTWLNVGSNSSVVVQSSSLETGFISLAGTFSQSDFSLVKVHGALEIWDPVQFASDVVPLAAYYLTNGTLSIDNGLEVGGGFRGSGQFVQYGGDNNIGGIAYVDDHGHSASLFVNFQGELDIYGGQVTATNGIAVGFGDYANGAYFHQYGGNITADSIINGNYTLNGGIISGRMSVVAQNAYQRVDAYVLQTGGTNHAISLDIGQPNRYGGRGFYVLSNGVARVDSSVGLNGGQFSQYNGLNTIISNLVIRSTEGGYDINDAHYLLAGGTLSVGAITVQSATFEQTGGSNLIAGDIDVVGVPTPPSAFGPQVVSFTLGGGLLSARNLMVNAGYYSGFRQTAGSNQITEKLTLQGVSPGAFDYTLEGGTLAVKDISVADGAFFAHTNGTIIHSGLLTLSQGEWRAAAAAQSLGPLQLTVGSSNNNSAITFPNGSSTLRLANSSAQAWAANAILYITNWHGSISGGGATQLYFGSNSSGLTIGQLARTTFSNPGGFPAGNYPAKLLSTGELVPDAGTPVGGGTVNNWTNPASGRWDSAANWSLATLPASNQTVNITNAGYKAGNIDNATVSGFPNSLTVSNLSVSAPTNALSTLLLNYAGLGTPLKVLNDCTVGTNGTIANYYSSLEVDGSAGGSLAIAGGQFIQEGGVTVATTTNISITDGSLNATNASMTLGPVTLGNNSGEDGQFNQSGGSIAVASLSLRQGSYNLYGGILYALGGTGVPGLGTFTQYGGTNFGAVYLDGYPSTYRLLGGLLRGTNITANSYAIFCQGGGEVQAGLVSATGYAYRTMPNYFLTNGVLRAGTLSIRSSSFLQMNGQVIITNPLSIYGYDFPIPHVGVDVYPANYTMQAGALSCPSLTVTQYVSYAGSPFASFTQSAGTNMIAGGLSLYSTTYSLDGGGLLQTSNTLISTGAAAQGAFNSGGLFQHQSGTHNVTGMLSINPGSKYYINGGSLSVGQMLMQGLLAIGNTNGTLTVSCSGLFDLGGLVQVQVGAHHLGSLRLTGNSSLNFGNGSATVNFDSGSSIGWSNAVSLVISNWNNSGNVHIFFGSNASGLSASQLAQIQFSNPGSYPPGNYGAQLLSTGELVPVAQPTLQSARYGSALVLTWPSGYQLLSATNVNGPYTPVSGATSPQTNSFLKPREFFRLQGL